MQFRQVHRWQTTKCRARPDGSKSPLNGRIE
jgi:hypothetical protein